MEYSSCCKSTFMSGKTTASSEKLTKIWIELINQMERSKATLAKIG